MTINYMAFEKKELIAKGSPLDVALEVKKLLLDNEEASILIFNAMNGTQVDLNLSGSLEEVRQRFSPKEEREEKNEHSPKVGRPKLGVISREISLLPRHWEWLASQPTSASMTLRKLVEEAQRRNKDVDAIRLSIEATHRFMTAIAGDLVGYEEALRALYVREEKTFNSYLALWPKDVATEIKKLANDAFRPQRVKEK